MKNTRAKEAAFELLMATPLTPAIVLGGVQEFTKVIEGQEKAIEALRNALQTIERMDPTYQMQSQLAQQGANQLGGNSLQGLGCYQTAYSVAREALKVGK